MSCHKGNTMAAAGHNQCQDQVPLGDTSGARLQVEQKCENTHKRCWALVMEPWNTKLVVVSKLMAAVSTLQFQLFLKR